MLYLYNLQGILEDADSQAVTVHARTATGTSGTPTSVRRRYARVGGQVHGDLYGRLDACARGRLFRLHLGDRRSVDGRQRGDRSAGRRIAGDADGHQDADRQARLRRIKQRQVDATDGRHATSAYDAAKSAASQASVTSLGSPMQAGASVALATAQPNYVPAKAGDAMALTVNERNTLAGAVWSATTCTLTGLGSDFLTTVVAGVWKRAGPGAVGNERGQRPHGRHVGIRHLHNGVQEWHGAALRPRLPGRSGHPPGRRIDVVYSVYLLDDQDPDARTAVTGQTAVSLNAADVIFDTLQDDSQASDYNFMHVIPIGVHPAFTIAGRNYLVEYTITPTAREKIILRFRVNVL